MISGFRWFKVGPDKNGGERAVYFDGQLVRDHVLSSDAVALVDAANLALQEAYDENARLEITLTLEKEALAHDHAKAIAERDEALSRLEK